MGSQVLSNPKAYAGLYRELRALLPASRILRDPVSLLAHGSDAGLYRLIPKMVVKVENEKEAATVLSACHRLGLPVTFRAAGTSLSGQAISDSILLQIGRGFSSLEVLEKGLRIRLQPAVIGSAANRRLTSYGRKLGPDPASIDSAMIGGIAANNASGMCCGVAENCYRTLESMRLLLADGTLLDTADTGSREAFALSHRSLLEGLSRLAEETRADADLRALIIRKYAMKNTTGYGLNALVDYHDPFDILQHLLIGSEGTLGFISEITLRTVADPPHKSAILAFFHDAESVGRAIQALAAMPVKAVEYMDEASLLSVMQHPVILAALSESDSISKPDSKSVQPQSRSALLIDIRADSEREAQGYREEILHLLSAFPCSRTPVVARLESEYASLWAIRKGLFPAIGALRPPGTAIIIEDVAFPIHRITEALSDLRRLLVDGGYPSAIIYGHALSGNLHFVFWQDFSVASEVERYSVFMEKLADLVVDKYQGSLKAEHGTGRNMAPYVEKEWGSRAYALMKSIKALFDPQGILNPDVILSADKRIHLKNLKPLPLAHPLVDKCIECGFCENVCPSKEATLTPRQRIVAWREITRLRTVRKDGLARHSDERLRLKALVRGFAYAGEKTCATDGLCAMKCPVGIDTGSLIKTIRGESKKPWQLAVANGVANHFDSVLVGTRLALGLLQYARELFGEHKVNAGLRAMARWLPALVPAGLAYLPRPGKPLGNLKVSPSFPSYPSSPAFPSMRVLYFPSCINRAFGPERPGDPTLAETMVTLMRRAGFEVLLPEGVDALCCGLAFASKGFAGCGESKLREARAALAFAGKNCAAVICDTSPCTQRLMNDLEAPSQPNAHAAPHSPIKVMDSVAFLASQVLPRLQVHRTKATIALHPTCSMTKMGLTSDLNALASACAVTVVLPEGMSCCGVAGDRIFLQPELPLSACAPLRTGLPEDCREGYSNSRTCEIGLSLAGGIPYRSILYLLEEATAPSPEHKPTFSNLIPMKEEAS